MKKFLEITASIIFFVLLVLVVYSGFYAPINKKSPREISDGQRAVEMSK